MKEHIEILDYAGAVTRALASGGILLNTALEGKVNTMTIGWGFAGRLWQEPYVIALVRESRYSHQLLEKSGEFTISVPMGKPDRRILGYAGTKSGRDTDKIKDLGLTLEEPEATRVPGIREFPLTAECVVSFKQPQDREALSKTVHDTWYGDEDYHVLYFGKVLKAYIIK